MFPQSDWVWEDILFWQRKLMERNKAEAEANEQAEHRSTSAREPLSLLETVMPPV